MNKTEILNGICAFNYNRLAYNVAERLPNEKDIKRFVYGWLRRLYFYDKRISLIQYRTVKGQIFKDYELGYNFMKKYYPFLDRIIEKYKTIPIKYFTI